MKKVFSILLFVISSQILLAHPGVEHHSHDSFMGEWAWLVIPAIALVALVWKFNSNKSQSEKSKNN
ncbi:MULTISPECIES: hypothetical protein [Winogradskyella]|uniref:hypothetical protein n=1 Tax=Winogradskyella TaxID=286104 RepID=UPI0015C93CE4|nr:MULTISPECIES: hypothetical protein [Winogradskyella]QXP78517.1 hypothetical protein H0I32_15065 [Winogradskyella sp. HaHa_3_26]